MVGSHRGLSSGFTGAVYQNFHRRQQFSHCSQQPDIAFSDEKTVQVICPSMPHLHRLVFGCFAGCSTYPPKHFQLVQRGFTPRFWLWFHEFTVSQQSVAVDFPADPTGCFYSLRQPNRQTNQVSHATMISEKHPRLSLALFLSMLARDSAVANSITAGGQ